MANKQSILEKIKLKLNKIPSAGWQSFWSGIGLLLMFLLENQETLNIPSQYSVVIGMISSVILNRYSKWYMIKKDKVQPVIDEFTGGAGEIPNNIIKPI